MTADPGEGPSGVEPAEGVGVGAPAPERKGILPRGTGGMGLTSAPVAAFGAIRLVWGVYLLTRPGAALRLLSPHSTGSAWRVVVRVLGGRQAAQGALTIARGPGALETGSVVDLLHGASAVVFALARPQERRLGAEEATLAAVLAAAGLALQSSQRKVRFE